MQDRHFLEKIWSVAKCISDTVKDWIMHVCELALGNVDKNEVFEDASWDFEYCCAPAPTPRVLSVRRPMKRKKKSHCTHGSTADEAEGRKLDDHMLRESVTRLQMNDKLCMFFLTRLKVSTPDTLLVSPNSFTRMGQRTRSHSLPTEMTEHTFFDVHSEFDFIWDGFK